jgi:hypothetical protein
VPSFLAPHHSQATVQSKILCALGISQQSKHAIPAEPCSKIPPSSVRFSLSSAKLASQGQGVMAGFMKR